VKLSKKILCAAPLTLIAQLSAAAADADADAVPVSRGTTSSVAEMVGRVIHVGLDRGENETLVEVSGLTRNMLGQSTFDKMMEHCLISFTRSGGRSSAAGACRETDSDGDILFTSFDGEAGKLLGGTGKYGGMTGSAVFSIKPQPSSEPGKIAYSVRRDVTWALPGSAVVGGSAVPNEGNARYLPIQSISYEFGSKAMRGYFVQQGSVCVVTLMISERSDLDSPSPSTATRLRLMLDPGQIAGLDSEEGRSLNFTCGEDAAMLIVDYGERSKLMAQQGTAISNTVAERVQR
jgi:hypothetical protein